MITEQIRIVFQISAYEKITQQTTKNFRVQAYGNVTEQIAAICSRWFLAREFYYPEDGGDTFLRNVGSHKIYTAPHPRKRNSSIPFLLSAVIPIKDNKRTKFQLLRSHK
jgi:hypothetical protein